MTKKLLQQLRCIMQYGNRNIWRSVKEKTGTNTGSAGNITCIANHFILKRTHLFHLENCSSQGIAVIINPCLSKTISVTGSMKMEQCGCWTVKTETCKGFRAGIFPEYLNNGFNYEVTGCLGFFFLLRLSHLPQIIYEKDLTLWLHKSSQHPVVRHCNVPASLGVASSLITSEQ